MINVKINSKIRSLSILCIIFLIISAISPVTIGIVRADIGAVPGQPGEPGQSVELYVSPDGNDNNPGTMDEPFASIEGARDYIHTINSNMSGDITVNLRGGEYDIDSTIDFVPADSGTNGYTISYRNYPGEKPVFTSAEHITGWTSENGVFKTNVGDLKFRDLFINGQRGMRARTESYSISSWNSGGRTFSINSSAFESWSGFSSEKIGKIEAVLNTHWVESYTRMISYAVSGSTAAVSLDPSGEIIFTRDHPDRAVNQSVHFENAYEFMDKPGEWYLDEDSGDLFYIPRAGETLQNLDAVVGTLETFVSIKGTMNERVRNLVISGITFEYTTFNLPVQNKGIVFSQGGMVRDTVGATLGSGRQPAALYMEGADNVKINRNTFRHMGATAIDIKYMAHNNEITGNAITDIAGNGIVVGVFNDNLSGFSQNDPLSQARNNKISNNYLRSISADYYDGTGILLGYTNGTTIEHNEISDVGYSAIGSGWGWTPNTTSLGNTRIVNNNIYQYVTRQSDGAAIYTLSNTPNSEIAGNYIHDDDRNQFASNYPLVAIYLDQATAGYNVHDNVSTRVDVKLNLNMITDGANTFSNNDSQDQSIKDNAGLLPEYWDIVPDTIHQNNGSSWTAATYGGVRLSGTVDVTDPADTNTYTAAIYKNGTPVWTSAEIYNTSGAAITTSGAAFNVNLDVQPGDIITFEAQDQTGTAANGVSWDMFIKPEVYVPRLVILDVTHPDQVEPAEISDRTKTVLLKVKPGTDIKDFHPTITVPPGTVLEYENEQAPADYSKPVKLRVYMEEGSDFPGFDGGRKWKEWEVKVLIDSEAAFVKGFNMGDQIDDSDNWYISAGHITEGTNSLTFSDGGYSIYKPKMFTDELLEFSMNTPAQGWPSITFRNQSNTAEGIGGSSSCYITVIKPEGIELQRFNNGNRTVFYGNIGETPGLIGGAIPNTFFNFGEENQIQVGAMNTDEGVRLLMYINGKKVFDCIDSWTGKITTPGYFGTHQYGGPITLTKTPVVKSLNDAVQDTGNWYMSAGSAAAGTNGLTLGQGGYAMYQGEQFQDELLELTMNTQAVGWPSITFRNQSPTADGIGPDSSCYIAVIKPDVIELQRFNNGTRVPLYITGIGESAPLIGNAIPNTFFLPGKDNIVQVGAINTNAGVRLIMYINGKKVFDCVDKWDGKITEPGYFGTYQASAPIILSKTPKSESLAEEIADTGNWHMSAGMVTEGINSVTFGQGGYAVYQGKQFQDEMLEFYMNTAAVGWPSITFRNQSDTADGIGTDSSCYITVIKPDVIELQRFNAGQRTVFYGNIGENPGLIGDAIPNTFFIHGQDNLVQLGSINTDTGVRLVMYINGKLVYDCVDSWDGKITGPGYFGTYQAGGSIKLSKRFDTTAATEKFSLLDFEISKVTELLAAAPVGNAEGQYAPWAKEYTASVLAGVQEFRSNADDSTGQEAVNLALSRLKAAEAVFGKALHQMTNIALGKTVTSSDGDNVYLGYEPYRLVDGTVSPTNGWSPMLFGTINGWAQIDLGSEADIKRIEVVDRPQYPDQTGARRNFEIQASNDPTFSTYEVLASVGDQGFPDDATWQYNAPDGTRFRYIRYQKTDSDYHFVSEIRVLGSTAPETYTVSGEVLDEKQQPISRAGLTLYSSDDQETALGTAATTADGRYTIDAAQVAGKYVLKAHKTDFTDESLVIFIPFENIGNADISMQAAEGQGEEPEDTAAPEWPEGSDITASNIGRTGVDLTWSAATDNRAVTSYKLYNGTTLAATLNGNVNSYKITGLTAGTRYTFTVQAGDAAGNWSTAGPSLPVITLAPPTGANPVYADTPAPVLVGNDGGITLTPKLNGDSQAVTAIPSDDLNKAIQRIAAGADGVKTVPIEIKKVGGAKEYVLELPVPAITSASGNRKLQMITEFGTLTVPSDMLESANAGDVQNAAIGIKQVDKDTLGAELKKQLGGRPVVELTLKVNGVEKAWENKDAPVEVSIPYTPTAAELADPEHIVVWYIDNSGEVIPVPNGKYDSSTGTVTFTVTHFSSYAVSYVKKTFNDTAAFSWARKQIEVMASKGIISGTSATTYSPGKSITRADFMVILIKTLGLDADFNNNFSDVNPTAYYADEVGTAKKLGITNGTGNNRFDPDVKITRQDMMTLIYKAMKAAGKKLGKGTEAGIVNYADKADIVAYALDSIQALVESGIIKGDGNNINPLDNTTRAEAAVVIYSIYNK